MKHTQSSKDTDMLGDLYQMISESTQINEGSMPFSTAKFAESLKNASRFMSDGEMNDLGLSGIRHTISRFHMDAAAKKEATNFLQQQGMQLLSGASEGTLDKIMSLVRQNQGSEQGVMEAPKRHGSRRNDYTHEPADSESSHRYPHVQQLRALHHGVDTKASKAPSIGRK